MADRREVSPAQLREHLAATLPSYMVPARLVIMPGLPTLSSGKIDRQALGAFDIVEQGEADLTAATEDPLIRTLLEVWTDLLGRPVTDTSASFFDLGGDSLLVVQMFTEIDLRLGRTCDAPAFLKNPTVSNLATLLRSAAQTGWSAPLVELARGKPGVRPLFLAPGLSGRGFDYVHLAEGLRDETPVYALQTPASPTPGAAGEPLARMAKEFVARIREVQPRGPYALAGFSAGGVAAMAIAQELRALGESTDLVAIIDSVPPKSVPVPSPFTSARRLARFSRTVVGRVRETMHGPRKMARLWSRARSAVLRGATRWNLLPIGHEPSISETFADTEGKLSEAERERMGQYFDAIWNHRFQAMPVDVVLLRVPLDPFEGPHEPELGWGGVTSGKIEVEYLVGTHRRVLSPEGSRELAALLRAHLRRRPASPG
jgi:thioesterase domain-containing protein/acyl carrier protein